MIFYKTEQKLKKKSIHCKYDLQPCLYYRPIYSKVSMETCMPVAPVAFQTAVTFFFIYFKPTCIIFLFITYLRSTGGRRAPEGVHGGKILGLYRWRGASTGSVVWVAGEPLVHFPGGTERECDSCRYRGERDVTCSDRREAAVHTQEDY